MENQNRSYQIAFQDECQVEENNTPNLNENVKWFHLKFQIVIGIFLTLSMAHGGMSATFSNLLMKDVNAETNSWLATINAISTPLGTLLVSTVLDRLGRKRTLLAVEVGVILSWLLLSFSNTKNGITLLFIGFLMGGLIRGAVTSACSIYISEIINSSIRQSLLAMMTFSFTIGIFMTSLINLFFRWNEAAILIACCFLVILLVTGFLLPESPHWLAVIKLNLNRSEQSLKKLNPYKVSFDKEWMLLKQKIQTKGSDGFKKRKLKITDPSVYKPSAILAVLLILQQISGIYCINSYMLLITPKIGFDVGSKYNNNIFLICGICRIVVVGLNVATLTRFNQNQMLTISSLSMLLSSVTIVGCVIAKNIYSTINWLEWLSVGAFVFYTAGASFGVMGTPWTIVSELLPTEIKGVAGPIFLSFGYTVMALLIKIFPFILNALDVIPIFSFFAIDSLLILVFTRYCIPNTKGKSLFEIEHYFRTGRFEKPKIVTLKDETK